jgi:hypothetical protein
MLDGLQYGDFFLNIGPAGTLWHAIPDPVDDLDRQLDSGLSMDSHIHLGKRSPSKWSSCYIKVSLQVSKPSKANMT